MDERGLSVHETFASTHLLLHQLGLLKQSRLTGLASRLDFWVKAPRKGRRVYRTRILVAFFCLTDERRGGR